MFLSTNFALAQSISLIKHKVQKGETVIIISKKYNVTPSDIYKLNPDAQNGVEENTILIIPNKAKVKVEVPSNSTVRKHTVFFCDLNNRFPFLYFVFYQNSRLRQCKISAQKQKANNIYKVFHGVNLYSI